MRRLLAIMLGHLEMDIDDCFEAVDRALNRVLPGFPPPFRRRYRSSQVEGALAELFRSQGITHDTLFVSDKVVT
jgi:hypothetical protein